MHFQFFIKFHENCDSKFLKLSLIFQDQFIQFQFFWALEFQGWSSLWPFHFQILGSNLSLIFWTSYKDIPFFGGSKPCFDSQSLPYRFDRFSGWRLVGKAPSVFVYFIVFFIFWLFQAFAPCESVFLDFFGIYFIWYCIFGPSWPVTFHLMLVSSQNESWLGWYSGFCHDNPFTK